MRKVHIRNLSESKRLENKDSRRQGPLEGKVKDERREGSSWMEMVMEIKIYKSLRVCVFVRIK